MQNKLASFFSPHSKHFPESMALLCWVLLCVVAVAANGTADDGDSVNHYLYSHYAFTHPENFFNHWAKPLFVMVTAPVAYFGFTAMKIFNASMLGLQMWMNINIARRLNMSLLWLIPWMSIAAPLNFTHTLSGLTEPMFATVFTGAVLLMVSGRTAWAYIIFSFLPLVRSEGLVIMCPLLLYALWNGHFRYLPLFAVGHIFVGILGYPLFGNIWWTITHNPYRHGNDGYGSGTWDHYLVNMPFIIGGILCVLGGLGILSGFYRLIWKGGILRKGQGRDEAWLVYAMFLAYLIAHSIFWWKGLFASYGLVRVFICIMPSIMLICIRGLETLDEPLKKRLPKLRTWLAYAFIPLLWFVNFNPRVSWPRHLELNESQLAMRRALAGVQAQYPDLKALHWYTDAPDAAYALGQDYFDRNRFREGWRLYTHEPIPDSSIVLWDDHFMALEAQVKLEKLQKDDRLMPLPIPEDKKSLYSGEPRVRVFVVKPAFTQTPKPGWSYEWKFDTMQHEKNFAQFAGRNCIRLDKESQYSKGFQSAFGSFPDFAKIKVSFDVASPEGGEQIPGAFCIGYSTVHEDYFWEAVDLKKKGNEAGQWHSYSFVRQLPKARGDFDRFRTYIWNTSDKVLYVHNFKVEWVE